MQAYYHIIETFDKTYDGRCLLLFDHLISTIILIFSFLPGLIAVYNYVLRPQFFTDKQFLFLHWKGIQWSVFVIVIVVGCGPDIIFIS